MSIIDFRGQVRILFIFLIVDIIINSIFPSIHGPMAATAILGALHLMVIGGVIAVEYVILVKSLYVKAGSWGAVIKVVRFYVLAVVLHVLLMTGVHVSRIVSCRLFFSCLLSVQLNVNHTNSIH
jgi:hypothetical protein